ARSSTVTARSRSGSEPSPTPPTTSATPTIVIVNVTISPITTPSGRRCPPTPPADSSAGSTGSTHGDSAVPAPARMANPIRTIICSGDYVQAQPSDAGSPRLGRIRAGSPSALDDDVDGRDGKCDL